MASNEGILSHTPDGWVVQTSNGQNIGQAAGGDVKWQCKAAIGELISINVDEKIFVHDLTPIPFKPTPSDYVIHGTLRPGKEMPAEPLGGFLYDIYVGGESTSGPPGNSASGGEETRRRPRIRVSGGLFPDDKTGPRKS